MRERFGCLAATLLLLVGCSAEPARTLTAEWADRQMLIVASTGSGEVRVFTGVGNRPVPTAILRAPGRDAVLALRIDEHRDALWVLGRTSLDLHDLRHPGGALRLRQPLAADARAVGLVAGGADGVRVIDKRGGAMAEVAAIGPCLQ